MQKMTPEEEGRLQDALRTTIESRPPSIGVVGVSGVGKSSTINAMFKSSLPISHTVACTKAFEEVPLRLTMQSGHLQGHRVDLVVYDAPGLGEDVRKDPDYISMYERHLPECDVVLWITAARNRAVALDQQYLRHFLNVSDRIVFGISQVDLVEPRDWKSSMPIPSETQERHIAEIVSDRRLRFSDVIGREVECIPYSNYRGFNLEHLFAKILDSCADHRSWIFHALKGFSLEDYVGTAMRSAERERDKNKRQESLDQQARREDKTGMTGLISAVSQFLLKGVRGTPPEDLNRAFSHILGRPVSSPNELSNAELGKVQEWISDQKGQHLDKIIRRR